MPEARTLLDGIAFGESPRWHDDRLWFSDWGTQEVVAVELEGESEVIVGVPSSPFSIDWLPDGRMLIVSGPEGVLLRREPDGSLATHADLSGLSEHPWNEIVVDSRGNAYINNIGFAFPAGEFAPGTVALLTPDGSVRRVADGLAFPNGMAVTPDNSMLIVAESYAHKLTALVAALVSPQVASRLDPERSYGIWWYNRRYAQRTRVLEEKPDGERRYITRTRYAAKPREEWIAVPVPDADVPKEDVDRAREALRHNEKCSSAGRRFWELSGGVFRCAQCGRALVAVTALKGPKGHRRRMFY